MKSKKQSSNKFILPSDLTPKQLEALPFEPGTLSSFDEKEKLPPTARAQWAWVRLNPTEYLERFTTELGLLGINVAILFINKDLYEDSDKELRTTMTVSLIVHPDQYDLVKAHIVEKKLSYKPMGGDKGFLLPFLGSIQKTLDTLALENLMNYAFIKNSISREAYSIWLSVPKSYLDPKKSLSPEVDTQNVEISAIEDSDSSDSSGRKPQIRRSSTQKEDEKENFNYVIYDDTGETVPPIPLPVQETQSNSVVVSQNLRSKKPSFLNNIKRKPRSKKEGPKADKEKTPKKPAPKLESLVFVSLALFNFFTSVVFLTLLSTMLEEIQHILIEATTAAAFISLLIAMAVVKPSLKWSGSGIWTLGAYLIFAAVSTYQVLGTSFEPGPQQYLVPTAIALVTFLATLVASFMRIDKAATKRQKNEASESKETGDPVSEEITGKEGVAATPPPVPATKKNLPVKKNFPIPVRPKAQAKMPKLTKNAADSAEDSKPDVAAESEPKSGERSSVQATVPAQQRPITRNAIPANPISEEQKDVIRSRLARRDRLAPNTSETTPVVGVAPKQLSSAEIKAKLASRLQRSKASSPAESPDTPVIGGIKAEENSENGERKTIRLRKPDSKQTELTPHGK